MGQKKWDSITEEGEWGPFSDSVWLSWRTVIKDVWSGDPAFLPLNRVIKYN